MAETPRNPELQALVDEFVRTGTDEARLALLAAVNRDPAELVQQDINVLLGYQPPEPAGPEYPGCLSGRARDRGDDPLPEGVVSSVMARRAQDQLEDLRRQAAAHAARVQRHRDFDRCHGGTRVQHYRAPIPWWVTPWTLLALVFLISLIAGH